MKFTIFYCYDAYCGWCYGFSPVIKKIAETFKNEIDFEVLSGGMIIADKPASIETIAPVIKNHYKQVEELTGIKFGEDFLWHAFNPDKSDWFLSSEKPAIALCIFKEIYPNQQVAFAADLQYALNFEGRDLTDDEAYRHLVLKYNINEEDFYKKLHSNTYKEKAYYEFQLCKQLKVTGFPCVLLQASDSKFYLLTRGYTDFETLQTRIKNVLQELNNS
ncbi:MAG: DsbA family protein [Bacteroidetes bacterium]|nr:DsbA family protein [Bacteroidota bacterium]MBS1649000.1 DsbA family protein [Bacteroidota bacterium]